ncbi:auxin response factor 17 [Diospyros lotus]|uniref:auxin response factor 17 n=1 Tax=Diospyros lotus TaxID=55363 RepID=UPI0022594405|nr:auxin response factor 17 [Diospyros lotus]XP_052190938.1 auxin response factor 17 [Diospyros lotus]
MVTTTGLQEVDPRVWKAAAGAGVQVPAVDSRVYYFPQGHAEQCSSPPLLSPLITSRPLIHCRIAAIHFLANPVTDEVFAKIRLVPTDRLHDIQRKPSCGGGDVDGDDREEVVSFAKVLTTSDANNGGGFSVPRFCADSIFPPLNYAADPPVQTLTVRDLHGTAWEFRHIYRGTPRRHLLTTGWSKFVNYKHLVSGDSVVFMRKRRSGELSVGVRRTVRSNAGSGGRWNSPVGPVTVSSEENDGVAGKKEFSRSGSGRVTPESMVEAAELAAQSMAFEIVYYPRFGSADFVVKAETVEESLNVSWGPGMRVKMAMETEEPARMNWFQGTVSSVLVPENGPWRSSPWRMLQVMWDEPAVLQNAKRVSPWQVEYIDPTPLVFRSAKKFKVSSSSELPMYGEGDIFFPITGLSDSLIGNLNPSSMNYNSFPAGMQGARQASCITNLPNFISENTHQMCSDRFFGNSMTPKLKSVSTDLNIGSSLSDNLSPDSQSSVHFFGSELAEKQGCNSMKLGLGSFQLFGKIIHLKDPVESGVYHVDGPEDNGSKMFEEAEGVKYSLDLSLTCPFTELVDGQCQRASTVEACSL